MGEHIIGLFKCLKNPGNEDYLLVRFFDGERYRKAYFLKTDLADVLQHFCWLSEALSLRTDQKVIAKYFAVKNYFINSYKVFNTKPRGSEEFCEYRKMLAQELFDAFNEVRVKYPLYVRESIISLASAMIRYSVGNALRDRYGD